MEPARSITELINREIAPFLEKVKAETPLSCFTIAEDFGRAFVQSAVIAPLWNGVGQLVSGGQLPHVSIVNEKNAESNVADSWAQKFGGAIGMAANFHILGKLKAGPFQQVETANTLSLAQRCGQHFVRSAKQGALYGAIFTESDPNNNMLYGRIANAGSQALTFGLLGSGSEALSGVKGLARVKPGTLTDALSDMAIAGTVGVPAGAVGSVADAVLNGRPVTVKEMQNAAIDYGIIGFGLAGINHGTAALKRWHAAQKPVKTDVEVVDVVQESTPQGADSHSEEKADLAPVSAEREAARKGLVDCLFNGRIEAAERIIDRKMVTAEEVREAAYKGLVNCLSKSWIEDAERIIDRKMVTEEDLKAEEVREAARKGLVNCLSKGWISYAERIIDWKMVTAEEVREAARKGLVDCLSNGWIESAELIIDRKMATNSTIDDSFLQSVQAGHITSVVRAGLGIGMDFKTITKEYLGISKLTDEEASKIFERMKEKDLAWDEQADVVSFEEGAKAFGAAGTLRYVFKSNASPHEALDDFGNVLELFRSSGLSAKDFYNNVLAQVNRDSAVDDIGHSYARLKAIAGDYRDNFDAVMEKAKSYPDIGTIQDLVASFPDKASIFSSWSKLQQFSKLEYLIGRGELLPKIQELRANGELKRAKWLETLALHPDSKVAKEPIEEFLLNEPTDFLERDDVHSSELHQHLKPSNYVEIPHMDLRAEELREALIDGTYDRLQVFTPMKVEYEVGGVDLAKELKRALGSRAEGQKGEAQNVGKLYSEVSKFLKQDKLTIAAVLKGAEMSQEVVSKITGLLYNKEMGLSRPPGSFKLIAEIHKKSDPLSVVAGDDTASCMQFGSGKNNVYMFNPNVGLFTVRLEKADGTQRTIAQSVLTKDVDVRELVPTIMEKMKKGESLQNVLPEEGMRSGKAVIAADNVEVHPNYQAEMYKSALEGVYRDFFGRYVELYGAKENLESDRIVVGLGHSDAMQSLPKEENTYVPQAPVAYSDKEHGEVSRLSLIAPQTKAVKAIVPTQVVRSMTGNAKVQAITELTFEDALPLSHLESKMYEDAPQLQQGLYDLENTLIAKDVNNGAKGRANLSFKYTDKAGKMRGYLLAYEGVAVICPQDMCHVKQRV